MSAPVPPPSSVAANEPRSAAPPAVAPVRPSMPTATAATAAAPDAHQPTDPRRVAAWKRTLLTVLAVLLTVAVSTTVFGRLHPPPPPARQYSIPLRVLGAPPPKQARSLHPEPLSGATVRFETRDRRNELTTAAQELTTGPSGDAKLEFQPGFALHIVIDAKGYAERDTWIEHPGEFLVNSPDFTVTLDPAFAGPRKLPLFVVRPPHPGETGPQPVPGASVDFFLDPTGPRAPIEPPAPTTFSAKPDGMVMLTFPPNRGGEIQVHADGYLPLHQHVADSYDYERRYPSARVELTPAGAAPNNPGASMSEPGGAPHAAPASRPSALPDSASKQP
ncbi:MAG: hypothetical protein ACREJ2_12885 [Planctomycetota bacterium]